MIVNYRKYGNTLPLCFFVMCSGRKSSESNNARPSSERNTGNGNDFKYIQYNYGMFVVIVVYWSEM